MTEDMAADSRRDGEAGALILQSEAQLEQVLDQLSKTQIVSPLDGVITSLDIKVGETAIASSEKSARS